MSLFEKPKEIYMLEYDPNKCKLCNVGEMAETEDGNIMCTNCYFIQTQFVNEFNYEQHYFNPFIHVYKKLNHFKEILRQFQGNQDIKHKLTKEWISDFKEKYNEYPIYSDMLPWEKLANVKKVLKSMQLSKWYKHTYLIYKLMGNKIIKLSIEFEERLIHMFNIVTGDFYNHTELQRIYCFNFYYLLSKLFDYLGKHEYTLYIIPMKLKKKIEEQDRIWNKIINNL